MPTITLNGKEITYSIEKNGKTQIIRFPTLYKIDKLGRTSIWNIYVIDDFYYRESGIKDGKVKEYAPVQAFPKNIGKANETTGQIQAILEAHSEWNHKKDQLYMEGEESTEEKGSAETAVGDRIRPMLADKWTEYKKYAQFPGAVSPKLDGVRVMIYKNDDEKTIMVSRLGKEYQHMEGIRREATQVISNSSEDLILDGELYSHNIPFNAISGAVRSQTNPSKYDEILEYYIFDLWVPSKPNLTYKQRMDILRSICNKDDYKRLRFLFYEEVQNESEIQEKHAKYVSEGYEGLMFRNLNGKYVLGRRVKDLLKYKEFIDEEFKVIDVIRGTGTEAGAAVFVCQTAEGEVFNVRPRGSIEKRKQQYLNKNKYIGKYLTVRYQQGQEEGVLPRFPVGIKFSDAKIEELVAVDFRDYE